LTEIKGKDQKQSRMALTRSTFWAWNTASMARKWRFLKPKMESQATRRGTKRRGNPHCGSSPETSKQLARLFGLPGLRPSQ
jgi:hypothetical protein